MQLSLDISNAMCQNLNSSLYPDVGQGYWLEHLHVASLCDDSSSQLGDLVPRENVQRGPGGSCMPFMTQVQKLDSVTSGIHRPTQFLREGNTGPTYGWEKLYHHILRRTLGISDLVTAISKNAICDITFLLPYSAILLSEIFIWQGFEELLT